MDQMRTKPSEDPYISIYDSDRCIGVHRTSSSCDEPCAIRGDMAAVDLEVLLFPTVSEPYWADNAHGECNGSSTSTA